MVCANPNHEIPEHILKLRQANYKHKHNHKLRRTCTMAASSSGCSAAAADTLSDQLAGRVFPLATNGGENRQLLAALDEQAQAELRRAGGRAHVTDAADVVGFAVGLPDQSRVVAGASTLAEAAASGGQDVARWQYNALTLAQTEAALGRL
jgi:hypothetical protein